MQTDTNSLSKLKDTQDTTVVMRVDLYKLPVLIICLHILVYYYIIIIIIMRRGEETTSSIHAALNYR